MRYTLIASDVHLSTVVRGAGSFMPYRRPEHLPDLELAKTFDRAVLQAAADRAELEAVLNGDLFDLDAPQVVRSPFGSHLSDSSEEDTYEEQRTAGPAARLMSAIMEDHPIVTEALGRVLSSGGRVVVIPGNHDSQLAFPAVRAALTNALTQASKSPRSQIIFRNWFHRTLDGVHIEHGHPYDPTCTMEYMGAPADGQLEDTVGSVTSHYVPLLLSHVNPYASDPLGDLPDDLRGVLKACLSGGPCTLPGYGATVARYLRQLLLVRPSDPEGVRDPRWLAEVARENAVPLETVTAHRTLFAPKADGRLLSRTLTRDHDYGKDTDARLRSAMLRIAALYNARGVVMGHTHAPFASARPGVWFANSGSWTPTVGRESAGPVGSFIWIASDGSARLAGELRHVWPSGVVT